MEKKRTLQQNKALHKFCTELANEANNHGISMKAVVQNLEVDWSMESIKSIIHAISKAKYGKTSTADLSTRELSDVCEEVQKIFLGFGVYVTFPSYEQLEFDNYYSKKV